MSEAVTNKYANVDGKRENRGNYQRALTLLNLVVGILTAPATATDASDCQPQLSPQVAQAYYERSAYISLFFFAYIISQQNIRVCVENATKTL